MEMESGERLSCRDRGLGEGRSILFIKGHDMPKVLLSSPVRGLQGKFAGSDVCYFIGKNGLTYARSAGEVSNPRTAPQQSVRGYFTSASKAWQTLTLAQRDGWLEYAQLYFARNDAGDPVQPSGLNTFVKANSIRQVLELPLVTGAPTEAPPAPLTGIESVGAMGPTTLGLEITHSIATITGLQVIVRMTPATISPARAPRLTDMRFVCGVGAESALALTASGTELTFTPTIFSLGEGDRFGVEARVVRTADGIMSQPIVGDFIKSI